MQNSRLRVLAQCALLTALFILSAFIRIPIPYVPITLQTFAVMLSALCFGGKITAVSLGAYILMGLCGLPVFTQGGGLGYFLKPTFGYLAGMLPAAAVCAFLSRRKKTRTYLGDFAACLGASLTIYLVGVPYLWAGKCR